MMIIPGISSSDRCHSLENKVFSFYQPFSIFMNLSAFIFESLNVMGLENEEKASDFFHPHTVNK